MYDMDDLIQLSALQHYAFCPRQCALIHIEQVWSESVLTAEGRLMHDHVHDEKRESRRDVRIEHGVPLRSLRLGLIGKADVIEFHRSEEGTWIPYPVEYKRGRPKRDNCDKIQLCAQALCLEEMLNGSVPEGALFYGRTRHRLAVVFDDALRRETEEAALQTRELIASGRTPAPEYAKRCGQCSLVEICLPRTVQKKRTVRGYLTRMMKEP
ncbi:MAG TPA: CRISPR-associated protein Cas4 [Deltaproteobacteria bacterium]|nr:CRISPR-associated protein Cas4 [Deltaproteobacteria bacterium]